MKTNQIIKFKFPKLWTSKCWGITYSFFILFLCIKCPRRYLWNVFKIKRVLNVATGQKTTKSIIHLTYFISSCLLWELTHTIGVVSAMFYCRSYREIMLAELLNTQTCGGQFMNDESFKSVEFCGAYSNHIHIHEHHTSILKKGSYNKQTKTNNYTTVQKQALV